MTRQLLNRHFSGFLAGFSQKVFPGLSFLSPWLLFLPHKTSKTVRSCLGTPPPQSGASWEHSWDFMGPGGPETLIRRLLNGAAAQAQPKGAEDGDNEKGDLPSEGWTVGMSSKPPHWSKPFPQFPGSGVEHRHLNSLEILLSFLQRSVGRKFVL